MGTISVSQARATLPEVVDRVLAGEEVTLTRHGRPVAVVVRPDALRPRRADRAIAEAERLRELLERSRSLSLDDAPALTEQQADELVAAVQAMRSER